MPLLLLALVIGVFLWAWVSRRNSTLTRACRWRLDRRRGPNVWRCAACGAECMTETGADPQHCLRDASRSLS